MEIAPASPPISFPNQGGVSASEGQGASANKLTADKAATGEPLSEEQQDRVDELKKRDAEVRAHEQAHAQVGGAYAGSPKYVYTEGPDGKRYATSGEVEIDVSPERTPEATIRKMDVVIRAALAPAEPSSQDQAVARQAQATRQQAQAELAEQETDEAQPGSPTSDQTQQDDAVDPASALAFQAAAEAYQAATNLFGGAS